MAKELEQVRSQAHDDTHIQSHAPTASGVRALEALLASGRPTPAMAVRLIEMYRGDRDAMFAMLHRSLGNAYVQEVVREMRSSRAEESGPEDATQAEMASPAANAQQIADETESGEELEGVERGAADGPASSVSTREGQNRDLDPDFDTRRALRTAQRDNARAGYCAKGVANVLEAQGLPVTRGDATNWWRTLPRLGWRLLPGVGPAEAPEGAVLVFTNNQQAGRAVTRRRGGQLYGHVEIVGMVGDKRVYISDAVRNNYGGTVPDNFRGAYVYGGVEPGTRVAGTGRTSDPVG
ncbi:MAG: hypothetical protein H0T42_34060 [Deltaproteobacteria bacterium]|nr:hypothetical protein [Deltaproteobacteria bacterium]